MVKDEYLYHRLCKYNISYVTELLSAVPKPVKTRYFDSYTKCMFVCFRWCWTIIFPCSSQTDVLAVYLQTQQHKVPRVKLERRLGWHRNTSCTNREKLCGFSFTLHRWKMENAPDLGDKMDYFSPRRNPSNTSAHLSAVCLEGRPLFDVVLTQR